MPYKHILAAVDLTEEADQVFQAATGVAAEHGATLSILSVIKPLAHVYGGLDMAPIAQGDISCHLPHEIVFRQPIRQCVCPELHRYHRYGHHDSSLRPKRSVLLNDQTFQRSTSS